MQCVAGASQLLVEINFETEGIERLETGKPVTIIITIKQLHDSQHTNKTAPVCIH